MARFVMRVAGETVFFDTHEGPHLDEIATKWLIEKFGDKEFLDKYVSNRILEVGIGGGLFDEHPVNSERKEGECAATLVAKALGVDDNPALEKILKFVVTHDLKGGAQPFDLASLVKLLHQQFPNDPERVIEWAMVGLEAKYREQLQFFTATKQEFERAAEIEEIQGPGRQTLKMVTVVSDDEQMSKFARSSFGGGAAIIIQRRSSGNVQIYTNKRYGLTLYDVAQMIRLAEQRAKGQVVMTDWETLSSEGKVEGTEEWFFHHAGQMLLNGSLTAPDVPPTKLSLEQIKEMVRIGINPQAFEQSRAQLCRSGNCTSTRNDQCPWYPWGLHRCRAIRYKMRNPNHFLNSR